MKIAIDIHSLEGGGWAGKEKYVEGLIKELAYIDKKNQYYLYLRKNISLNFPPNFKKRIIRVPSVIWHTIVTLDLLFLKPDVYLSVTSYIVPAIKLFTKSIVVIHDLVSFISINKHNKKAKILEKIFMKAACRRAKYIIAVSENTKKDLIKIFKIKSDKIIVIPEAPDSCYRVIRDKKSIKDVLIKYNLPENFILSIGTLEPRKNIVKLIEAYYGLVASGLTKYKLIIAGKKGWYYKEIFNKVKQLKLENEIIFTGYFPNKDIPYLYNAARCFIYPSLYEGFGLPVLEAMACGCPVITSNTSSLPGVAGDAAVLIGPKNIGEITSALKKVLVDSLLRESMIQSGFKQAKKFSWENTAEEIKELFNKLNSIYYNE
jgi:glycosyltransferase involved in cell wall biosynthesis